MDRLVSHSNHSLSTLNSFFFYQGTKSFNAFSFDFHQDINPPLKFDPQSTVAYVHISWKGSIDLPQIGESPLVASNSTCSGDWGYTLFRRLCIHRSRLDLLFLGLFSGKPYLRTCPPLERFGVENSISMIFI